MKSLGLLVVGLLLGATVTAQETGVKGDIQSKSGKKIEGAVKSETAIEASVQGQMQSTANAADRTKAAADRIIAKEQRTADRIADKATKLSEKTKNEAGENLQNAHGKLVSETAHSIEGEQKGTVVSEVASAKSKNKVEAGLATEATIAEETALIPEATHGTAVRAAAQTEVEAGTKGAVVSEVASAVGKTQSAAHRAVKSVEVATQAAVQASPKVQTRVQVSPKVDTRVNTKTEVRTTPIKVRTNTRIRGGLK